MNWLLYSIAGLLTLSILAYIGSVGEPRKPVSPQGAAINTLVYSVIIAAIVVAAMRMTT